MSWDRLWVKIAVTVLGVITIIYAEAIALVGAYKFIFDGWWQALVPSIAAFFVAAWMVGKLWWIWK